MAPSRTKCCVTGCDSTKHTQRLFCLPSNDHLRNLWMSFLVPTSPYLLGLSKDQLLTKRVCRKHFDESQFDQMGVRIRHSYPCLFTEKEFIHGVPLSSEEYNVLDEHNYFDNSNSEDDTTSGEPTILRGMPDDVHPCEHLYTLPPTCQAAISKQSENGGEAEETQVSFSAAFQASTISAVQNEGTSISRRSLADISQQENIETKLLQSSQPSTSKDGVSLEKHQHTLSTATELSTTITSQHGIEGHHDAERYADTHIAKKFSVDTVLPHTPKKLPLKGTSALKGFKAKTRRFIKETVKIAADNLGQTATERLQNAHKHASLEIMQNFTNLNKKAKAFLLMQLRLARKNKMARRFTFEDKLFALALMKQSPKGYKLLEHIFALPTKRTLARLAEKVVFECGMNQSTFDHIKHITKTWDTKKRLCSVVFDEVALTPHLTYNESKDIINGFEEIAGERRQKFADHALVFMVRGICSPWRQSIAYYFCDGTVSAPELEKILKDLVPRLSEAGLKPLALVCDQGSTFRSCFKNLKATTARLQTPHQRPHDTVNVAGHDLFIFHDPPHLLKSVRNNFLDKDVVFEGKRASWEDILYVYDLDIKAGHTRALPKLTADHVDPKRIKKMKVKMAAQVFSARTAAMLNYTDTLHKRLNTPKETMGATAALVLFFDELFDSVNGSPGQVRGKLRCAYRILENGSEKN